MNRRLRWAIPGYAIVTALLVVYGTWVCPFMNGEMRERPWVLPLLIAASFALMLLLELALGSRLAKMDSGDRWLKVEWLTFWPLAGLLSGGANVWIEQFPLGSGVKLLIGATALGFYASCYRYLRDEREHVERADAPPPHGQFLSIARRITGFNNLATAMVATVGILVVWNGMGAGTGRIHVLSEAAAVLATLSLARVIVSKEYLRYFEAMYRREMSALDAVQRGDYSVSVPVVSRDEFGMIAEGTNKMIEGLRERVRIRKTFGTFVGKDVLDTLLRDGGKPRALEVAVLFTDLRGYTPLSEKLTPAQNVDLLNEYFDLVVKAIEAHGGTVDKFIGDAVMAIWGLKGDGATRATDAIEAALEVRQVLAPINARLKERGLPEVDNGVGVHVGPVVAGSIGATDRKNYTVIGDAVNVASRLESLTRTLGSPIAVSEDAWKSAGEACRAKLVPLGDHALKGKSTKVAVYGLAATPDLRAVSR